MSLQLHPGVKGVTDILAKFNIARGLTKCQNINIVAGNNDFDTTEDQLVWAGNQAYTPQAAAAPLFISSETDADTMVIEINYLDTTWHQQTKQITLVGRTKTAVGVTAIRVNSLKVISAVNPTGPVWVYVDDTVTTGKPDTAAKVLAAIVPAVNGRESSQGFFSIPVNFYGLVRKIDFKLKNLTLVTARGCDFSVWEKRYGLGLNYFGGGSCVALGNNSDKLDYPDYRMLAPKTDIYVNLLSGSADNLRVEVGMQIILVPIMP